MLQDKKAALARNVMDYYVFGEKGVGKCVFAIIVNKSADFIPRGIMVRHSLTCFALCPFHGVQVSVSLGVWTQFKASGRDTYNTQSYSEKLGNTPGQMYWTTCSSSAAEVAVLELYRGFIIIWNPSSPWLLLDTFAINESSCCCWTAIWSWTGCTKEKLHIKLDSP